MLRLIAVRAAENGWVGGRCPWHHPRMLRYDVEIYLDDIDEATARDAIAGHHRRMAPLGDGFLARRQLEATHREVRVNGTRVGVAAFDSDFLTLLALEPSARRYDRQVMEHTLAEAGVREGYVASWDQLHVDLFGSFASGMACQAYQFGLPDPDALRPPVAGLALRRATSRDLPFLGASGFQDDYTELLRREQIHIAELDGEPAGIGISIPHPLDRGGVEIGMFTDADRRRSGVGRSILTLLARATLNAGRRPIAGCWWRNWASRRTLEAAGFSCVGTIFRVTLEPDRFAGPVGPAT